MIDKKIKADNNGKYKGDCCEYLESVCKKILPQRAFAYYKGQKP
jgi:hypothetical protein